MIMTTKEERQQQKRDARNGRKRHPVKDFAKDIVFVLVAFFFLNSFVLASFEVPTGSMENEIMPGDFLFVNKFIYGGSTPRTLPFTSVRIPWLRVPAFQDVDRGDVIVFEFPGHRDETESAEFQFYLKRAVALSGDTIEIVNRVLYVNRQPADLPRNLKFNTHEIKPAGLGDQRIFARGTEFNEDNWGPMRVPSQGDVIPLSMSDLEQWETFIKREGHVLRLSGNGQILIDGKPATTYTVEHNYLFGLGDNRDNSLDCRFWGFIPQENVVGTPMIVYWSWDPDIPLFDLFAKLGSIRFGRVGKIIK
jgi:signal peptidase I